MTDFLSPSVQIIVFAREEMKRSNLSEQALISIIWTSVMSCVEWNKKEELVTEQAIKQLKVCKPSIVQMHVLETVKNALNTVYKYNTNMMSCVGQ